MDTILIVPGLHGSGPDHWQTWVERQLPNCIRVIQSDWDDANLPRWGARMRRELSRAPGNIFIVAHSFGCLAAVQAAFDYREHIAGLMLVAPADPDRFGVSNLIPARPLGVPGVVVASTNDPWMAYERAAEWADEWELDVINLGAAGHVNPSAGFGPWPKGLEILRALRSQSAFIPERHAADDFYRRLGDI